MIMASTLGRYLSRHGIRAELRSPAARSSVGATLLEDAWSVEAQMLVMGGYGHSRMREFLIGGVTRHVLEHAPIPLDVHCLAHAQAALAVLRLHARHR